MEEEFKAQRELMEVKFEAVDKRFEAVDRRLQAVHQRFDDLIGTMKSGFASVDKRFTLIQWVMGVGFVILGTLVTFFQVLG